MRLKITVHSILWMLLLAGSAQAAQFSKLDLRFDSPRWKTFLVPVKAAAASSPAQAAQVRDGALACGAGTLLRTPFILNVGQQVSVQARVKLDGSTPSGKGAVVQVCGYDASQSQCLIRKDLALVSADGDWKTFKQSFSLPQTARYITVVLGNTADEATARFDDLHLESSMANVQPLIDDPGFEGILGQNTWFLHSKGKDWDGFALNPSQRAAETDSNLFVQGTKSLRIDGPGTVKSQTFEYHGETLWVGGWLKTKDVVVGKKPWAMAGVQVVGLNRYGREMVHEDLKLMAGTHPWQYYARKIEFNAAVKQVYVVARVFATAKGQFWADDLVLMREPRKEALAPFQASKADVTIDATAPAAEPIQSAWDGTCGLYPNWITSAPSPDYARQSLQLLKEGGFKYLRCREIMYGTNFYTHDDAQGNPVYNWKEFDELFDLMVREYGFIPVPTISTTPQALKRPQDKATYRNSNPPTDYKKWSQCVEAMLEHVIERYGADHVKHWVWEFWNEPGAKKAGTTLFEPVRPGGPTPFAMMYRGVVEAFAAVEKRHNVHLLLSMTSGGTGPGGDAALLQYLSTEAPDLIQHIRGFSYHRYAGANAPLDLLVEPVARKEALRQQYKMPAATHIWVTEWNVESSPTHWADDTFAAAAAVTGTRMLMDHGVTRAMFFSAKDYPLAGDKAKLFGGRLGLMTRTAIPKANYNSFVFMNRLRDGHRLKLTSSNRPIDGLAVVAPDGTVRIVLSSFDEDVTRIGYQTRVTVKVHASKPLKAARYWYVDQTHGNAFEAWKQMGRPAATDLAARKKLIEASRYATGTPPNATWNQKEQLCEIELTMPSLSVAYLELTPDSD